MKPIITSPMLEKMKAREARKAVTQRTKPARTGEKIVCSSAWLERSKRRMDEATAGWVQAWREAADAEEHEAKTRQVMLAARRRYESAMRSNDSSSATSGDKR